MICSNGGNSLQCCKDAHSHYGEPKSVKFTPLKLVTCVFELDESECICLMDVLAVCFLTVV